MDDNGKIACCVSCLLAENMKVCKVCPFNLGLPEREKVLKELQKSSPDNEEKTA
jgi:hypothetical protein